MKKDYPASEQHPVTHYAQLLTPNYNAARQVSNWLLVGVFMIVIQVVLGGITRLTESGLSITEWKPITGALPPLNDVAWQAEFDKYKGTDQFKYVHQQFSLSDFKFIFFWEWFHRVWARLMGMVFIIGFIYFLVKRKFRRQMVLPMAILFVLGALQGAIGWIMVKSGLVPEKYYVGHVELTTHLLAALGLLCYTLWFALQLRVGTQQMVVLPNKHKQLKWLLGLLVIQLAYGGFMAGLKAAVVATSWPDINGQIIPAKAWDTEMGWASLVNSSLMIHLIHRSLGYIILALSCYWAFSGASSFKTSALVAKLRVTFLCVVSLQVLLGILTVVNATFTNRLVWLGVTHQFVAMILLMVVVSLLYTVRNKKMA
ncbi:MAG: hypothetical protein RLY16_665 [Bacteroidota bacterium]|jgi:cytochrome c oxidase assembly protein subunit 15